MSDNKLDKKNIYNTIKTRFEEVEALIQSGERDYAIDKCLDILVIYKENKLYEHAEFKLKDPFAGRYFIFRNIYNVVGALKIMAIAKEIYKRRDEREKVIDVEGYIAMIYLDVFDYANADVALKGALKRAQEIKYIPGIVETMNIIGRMEYKVGNIVEAQSIMIEAYETAIDHDYNYGKRLSHNIGEIYLRRKEYDKALDLFKLAAKHCNDHHLTTSEGNSYAAIGRAYLGKGNNDKALKYIEKSLEIANVEKNDYAKIEIYDTYSRISENKKDFEGAYHYLKEKNMVTSTFRDEKGKKQLERIQVNYQLNTEIGGAELLKIKNIELETLSERLKKTNNALEDNDMETQRVQKALIKKNEELENSLRDLEAANLLIEASEKKETIAKLAFEIAEEMVGPLNMTKNSLKHFKRDMENTYIKTLNGELKRSELKHCFDNGFKVMENANKNLKRIDVYVSRLKMDPNSTIEMEELKVDLKVNLDQVLENLAEKMEEEKCSTTVEVKGDPTVRASQTLIRSMFEYIINSILNYGFTTPYNNVIELHIIEIKDKVLITCRDTGEIMNNDEINKALRPDSVGKFFNYSNRGYDLAKLNEHVVNFLSGELQCHSNPSEGNVIEIKLPKFTRK